MGELGTFSLREVACRAGVTAAAPYHHFRDKTAWLAAVAEEGFVALRGRLEASLAPVPPSDRLKGS
jgi:AcrR family transcriptional regulator